jgi:DNA-binding CsgD family transcriptional regulator
MRQPAKISNLIESIHDAALDPPRWNDVVVGIKEFVNGQACGIFSKDSISKFGKTHYYCGADPYYIQLYSDTHSKFDPLANLPRFGQVASIPDLVSFDEYRRGRFYQEWLRPQGCIDAANVVLEKSKSNCPVLLTVLSGKRMVDNEMRKRIGLIVPHAHRSLMINNAIDLKRSEAATFSETLDGLNAGIFLIDALRRIVHANAAGRDILSADDFLRSVAGQLVARNSRANQCLRDILACEGAIAENSALTVTAQSGERYVLHVLPLTSLTRNGATPVVKAVATVFVRKVELDNKSSGTLIGRAYGLTPTELRVLLGIAEIGGVPETAKALGIAESTAKTHLHRVFSKTGVNRQADLVKLVAGFSNPLADRAQRNQQMRRATSVGARH